MAFDLNSIQTINDLAGSFEQRFGMQDAIRWRKGDRISAVSFARFSQDIRALSAALAELTSPGAHIAIVGENSYHWLLCWFAAICAGRVAVPLDFMLPMDELGMLVKESDAALLLYAADFAELAQSAPQAVPMKNIPAMLAAHEGAAGWPAQTSPDDLAAIVYTSGTTGQSKGVMLSHWNFLSIALKGFRYFEKIRGKELMVVLPLHHAFGIFGALGWLNGGCTNSLSGGVRHFAQDLKTFQPYITFAVPLIMEKILGNVWQQAREQKQEGMLRMLFAVSRCLPSQALRRKLFKPILKNLGGNFSWVVCGGAALSDDVVKAFRLMGITIFLGYGITECSPIVSGNSFLRYRLGSSGPALDYCRAKEENGEILVKGENVFSGYYKNEAATREAFTPDGWFKTGDLGYLDKDGFIYITGRKKSLIILSNGKNVSPEPLEEQLMAMPPVLEALVYELDGKIAAEVFLDETLPDAKARFQELLLEFNRRLPSFQRIVTTIFRETEFPKTTSRKIKRK